jgi:hypothetical protein
MRIGIVAMSAKPFHAGHNALIKFAAGHELLEPLVKLGFAEQENDQVNVYVSYSSRGVKKRTRKGVKYEEPIPGEAPVFGKDMEYIWDNILTSDNLQYTNTNVSIVTPNMSQIKSPVTAGFKVAGSFKDAYNSGETLWSDPISNIEYETSRTVITFYCGEDDLNRYSDSLMIKLYGEMFSNGLINVIGIPRVVSISGTEMRDHLCSGNVEMLISMLPTSLSEESKQQIADILTQSVTCGYPSSRDKIKAESTVRSYIFNYINS